jgi:hypothetical protein
VRDLPNTADITKVYDFVVGFDGQLYVNLDPEVLQVDPITGSRTVIVTRFPVVSHRIPAFSPRLAGAAKGRLFARTEGAIVSFDLATGVTQTVIGTGDPGVTLGPLPAHVNQPAELATTATGDLLIGDSGEGVLLRARF